MFNAIMSESQMVEKIFILNLFCTNCKIAFFCTDIPRSTSTRISKEDNRMIEAQKATEEINMDKKIIAEKGLQWYWTAGSTSKRQQLTLCLTATRDPPAWTACVKCLTV